MGKQKAFHDILEYLRSNWCPRAFSLRPDYKAASQWVEIYDDTARWYRMPNKLMNGDELYAVWKRVITSTLCTGGGPVKKLVLICDDQDRVPNRKRAEQDRRKEAKTKSITKAVAKAKAAAQNGKGDKATQPAEPLRSVYRPSECYFTNEGVQFHGHSNAVELIDLRTLRASGEMRKDLYKYFMWKMQMDTTLQQTMDADATLVLDFHGDGPCIFKPNRGWLRLQHLKHPFGEADKAIVFWIIVYRELACAVITNDRDMIPILFHYAMCEGYTRGDRPLWWVYEKHTERIKVALAGCLDIMAMTHKVAERWDSQLWLLACCLCGTDYVLKRQCTPNAGQDVIFASVQRQKEIARAIRPIVSAEMLAALQKQERFEQREKCAKHNHTVIQCWSLLLQHIKQCGKSPNGKPLILADKLQALQDVLFNVGYWAEAWAKYRGVTELPE